MSQPASNPKPHGPITWAIITVLLLAALVGTLWVPFYACTKPKLGALPFFYWYQLMWVPIVAVLSLVAYLLIRRPGRPAAPDGAKPEPAGRGGPDGERTS